MHPIKGIFFDLDGVLVNSRILHYETFRDALKEVCANTELTWAEHEKRFDGLSTRRKLDLLRQSNTITEEEAQRIFERKQRLTEERLPFLMKARESLKVLLITLNNQGFRLFCCSNSIRKTLDKTLQLLEIQPFFEATYSNEDVEKPKPSPEIYQKAMKDAFLSSSDCLIIEDSLVGKQAAYASGAYVLEVEDAEDLTNTLLRETLYTIERYGEVYPRIRSNKPTTFHIAIPMTGGNSTTSNPFSPVGGKSMIQSIIDNMIPKDLPQDSYKLKFHLIVRSSHTNGNNLDRLFWDVPSNVSYTYHKSDKLTEGAVCSVLLAESEINNNEPLLIVNSDKNLELNSDSFYRCFMNPEYDGCILTFYQPNPYDIKWCYAKTSVDGLVIEVQEKKWISPYATVGLYGWKRGSDFVKYAKQMIAKKIRLKNEFYVCPVYNEAIQDGFLIRIQNCPYG